MKNAFHVSWRLSLVVFFLAASHAQAAKVATPAETATGAVAPVLPVLPQLPASPITPNPMLSAPLVPNQIPSEQPPLSAAVASDVPAAQAEAPTAGNTSLFGTVSPAWAGGLNDFFNSPSAENVQHPLGRSLKTVGTSPQESRTFAPLVDLLTHLGLTPERFAAMAPKDRIALMDNTLPLIEQKVSSFGEDFLKAAQKEDAPLPVLRHAVWGLDQIAGHYSLYLPNHEKRERLAESLNKSRAVYAQKLSAQTEARMKKTAEALGANTASGSPSAETDSPRKAHDDAMIFLAQFAATQDQKDLRNRLKAQHRLLRRLQQMAISSPGGTLQRFIVQGLLDQLAYSPIESRRGVLETLLAIAAESPFEDLRLLVQFSATREAATQKDLLARLKDIAITSRDEALQRFVVRGLLEQLLYAPNASLPEVLATLKAVTAASPSEDLQRFSKRLRFVSSFRKIEIDALIRDFPAPRKT